MHTSSGAVIPSWLATPPLSPIAPPVETRHQDLPFEKLKWEDFEKLCLRIARLEADVEDCREYGVRGQEQGGIDLYARRRSAEKDTVYQCKRESSFGPTKIKKAVRKFLAGEWAQTSDTFVLCTTESLRSKPRTDEVERQRAALRGRGVALETWDSSELSLKLKGLPELVDDFFHREWKKFALAVHRHGPIARVAAPHHSCRSCSTRVASLLEVLKNQLLTDQHQHVWCTTRWGRGKRTGHLAQIGK